jgi:hypothetical protein
LIDAFERARQENRDLKQRLTHQQAETKRLSEKLVLATEQVQEILARLPEEEA